jgi:hypothetical protein
MSESITGYRKLSQDELDIVNELKRVETTLVKTAALVESGAPDRESARWISLARTHLETGMMFLVKAVTRPTGGLGNK